VYSAACPLLVPLIEEGVLDKPETNKIVKKYLIPLKVRQTDTLILGCAHYSLLKKSIQQKIGMRVKVVDASMLLAEHVRHFIESRPETGALLSQTGTSSFFVSDMTEHIQKTAQRMFGKNVRIEAAPGFGVRDPKESPPKLSPQTPDPASYFSA
jgi:glutamate racemase